MSSNQITVPAKTIQDWKQFLTTSN